MGLGKIHIAQIHIPEVAVFHVRRTKAAVRKCGMVGKAHTHEIDMVKIHPVQRRGKKHTAVESGVMKAALSQRPFINRYLEGGRLAQVAVSQDKFIDDRHVKGGSLKIAVTEGQLSGKHMADRGLLK